MSNDNRQALAERLRQRGSDLRSHPVANSTIDCVEEVGELLIEAADALAAQPAADWVCEAQFDHETRIIKGTFAPAPEPSAQAVAFDSKLPGALQTLIAELEKINDKCRPGYMVSKTVMGWLSDALAIARAVQASVAASPHHEPSAQGEPVAAPFGWLIRGGGANPVEEWEQWVFRLGPKEPSCAWTHQQKMPVFAYAPSTPPHAVVEAVPLAERWVVVCESVLDVGFGGDVREGGRPELGYALLANATTFDSEDKAKAAIRNAQLPIGWVYMPLSRLLPDLRGIAPKAAQP